MSEPMTTAPDPKTVREIATEHILDCGRNADDIGAYVMGHHGPDALTKHQYGAWCSAIRSAIRTAVVTVEWPDEQQPADVVTDLTGAGNGVHEITVVQQHPMIGKWWQSHCSCGYFASDLHNSHEAAEQAGQIHVRKTSAADVVTADQQQDGAVRREAVQARYDNYVARHEHIGFACCSAHASADDVPALLAERTALAARVAELEGEREADTRAVAAVVSARNRQLDSALRMLRARFADRIAALDAAPEVVIGAGSPETSALTHCPTCGSPEWLADGRRGWNPIDVECEVCAGTYAAETEES
jgi:hypothetical protein